MNIGTIAHFFIEHNGTIFGVTATAVCLLGILVVYLNVFRKNDLVGDKVDYDFSKIEDSLKKILSQTHATIQTVASGDVTSAATSGPANPAEVSALKKELDERVKIIEELRAQVASAKADDGSAALLAKIKTLEGKLSEYEIIEDDIADLSHFKEENARLKKEIDAIKRGGPELVDQFAAAVSGGAPADQKIKVTGGEAPAGQTIVVEGAPAVAAAAQEQVTPPPETAPIDGPKVKDAGAAKKAEASLEDVVAQAQEATKDIAAEAPGTPGETLEFGDDGKAKTSAAPAPAPTPAPAPAAPAPVAAPAGAPEATPTNIFAEFSGSSEDNKDPLAELGEIDTNRMLEELKDLNMDMSAGSEALEEAPDMDKMAQEAQTLGKK